LKANLAVASEALEMVSNRAEVVLEEVEGGHLDQETMEE
jgi:hypothetical protein